MPTVSPEQIPLHIANLSSGRGSGTEGIAGRTSPTVLNILRMAYSYSASTSLSATGVDTTDCARRHRFLRRAIEQDVRFDLLDLNAFYRRGDAGEDISPF